MYRLYVDEVGTDALTHLEKDKHRFLSLTGVAMLRNDARDILEPALGRLKADIFDQDPDAPIILHRKEIMGLKGPFGKLSDSALRDRFNQSILSIYRDTPYTVITALIDKQWMARQSHWHLMHPYHYLMQIMVEKYVQFLERNDTIGDIMPESREGKDHLLQKIFEQVRADGTDYVNSKRICSRLRGKQLKFRKKKDNSAGLQLCDMLAHPSHIFVRSKMGHDVALGPFASQVSDILWTTKYDRSGYNGKIKGYGYKHQP